MRPVREKSKPNRDSAGMKILRPLSIVLCVTWTAGAAAQISLTPSGIEPPAQKPSSMPKPKSPAPKKPAAATATPKPATPTVTPAPVPDDPNLDLVYGAYQRGMYKTAFDLATKRAQDSGDPKAMTMLGELYSNGMGVKRDYAKAAYNLALLYREGQPLPQDLKRAAELFRLAADAGNPEAQYALATF